MARYILRLRKEKMTSRYGQQPQTYLVTESQQEVILQVEGFEVDDRPSLNIVL
jgi:hypothetical protein